jgi:hypothetical protein
MTALLPIASLPVAATGSYASDNTEVATDATVAIGGKTYTIKASGASADGEVNKGASVGATLANLGHAINLDGTAGAYGASMTRNPLVKSLGVTGSGATAVLHLAARDPGAAGNLIALGTAPTHWTRAPGALMTTGAGSIDTALNDILTGCQVNAQLEGLLIALGAQA